MPSSRRQIWNLPQSQLTEESVYRRRGLHRREFLAAAGLSMAAAAIGCQAKATPEQLQATKTPPILIAGKSVYPAERNPAFEYGRPETDPQEAAAYTNFYEFSTSKQTYLYVDKFQPTPWTVEIDGLCSEPRKFDLDDLHREFAFEERAYRHRCVETWAMCVPWTGFPLKALLAAVSPKPSATYVQFETFNRPSEAPGISRGFEFPWPYTEGLTIAEATNDLAFIATGIYGEPLPKQHGAPVRLVVPWKYGFKGIKSVVRITLTDKPPATFWNTVAPREYAFEANVDPNVPHPRWSQAREHMLGTGDFYPTVIYNGYGDLVGGLYSA